MKSLKQTFENAKDYLVKRNPTLGLSLAFASLWTVIGPSPVSYENYDANIFSKTAIYATSIAGSTGLIYGGFMLGGMGARRLTRNSDPQTQMFAGMIGASVAASLGSSLLMPYVDGVSNAIFAANDLPELQQEQQYAQADKGNLLSVEGDKAVYYDVKSNTLTIA